MFAICNNETKSGFKQGPFKFVVLFFHQAAVVTQYIQLENLNVSQVVSRSSDVRNKSIRLALVGRISKNSPLLVQDVTAELSTPSLFFCLLDFSARWSVTFHFTIQQSFSHRHRSLKQFAS